MSAAEFTREAAMAALKAQRQRWREFAGIWQSETSEANQSTVLVSHCFDAARIRIYEGPAKKSSAGWGAWATSRCIRAAAWLFSFAEWTNDSAILGLCPRALLFLIRPSDERGMHRALPWEAIRSRCNQKARTLRELRLCL